MLTRFRVKNFRSIVDIDLDFKYDEGKAPNSYDQLDTILFLEPKGKAKYIPCLSIYGANASGKTNIIKALDTLRYIVLNNIERIYQPNKLNSKSNFTTFELSFYILKKEYTFKLEYDVERVLSETLMENNKVLYHIDSDVKNFNKISGKGYSTERLEQIYYVECCNENKQQKVLFLNRIANNYTGLNKLITSVFNFIKKDIEIYPVNQFPFSFGMDKLASTQDDKAINSAFEKITALLKKLDIDIDRMQLERNIQKVDGDMREFALPVNADNVSFRNNELSIDFIYSYHKDVNGNEIKFKFQEESDGTKVVAGILGVFLAALNSGTTLVIDELERSLHPLLLVEIVRLFKDKRYNKNNAQLVFTSHNTDILEADLLRVSEIGIVRKTLNEGTVLRRISSFDGVRNTLNFRKQYLNGAFSGIPYPYI